MHIRPRGGEYHITESVVFLIQLNVLDVIMYDITYRIITGHARTVVQTWNHDTKAS